MVDVTSSWWPALVIAGIAGLVGGLIYELLLTRFGDSGMIERLSRINAEDGSRKYFDLGFLASMLIGAVAAIGFLYFMPPTEILNDAQDVIRREYDAFRLIPAALIVGSAGGAFLTSMQERVKRVVAQTTNANALSILEGAAGPGGGAAGEGDADTGGLVPAGPAQPQAVSTDTVRAAIRALGG